MYVYQESEKGSVWTVGFYSPAGEWVPESDHCKVELAARRTAWLNGWDDERIQVKGGHYDDE